MNSFLVVPFNTVNAQAANTGGTNTVMEIAYQGRIARQLQ